MFCAAGRAEADLTEFSFSYSGSDAGGSVSGSGFLFGTDLGGGTYLLTSGSGTSTEAGTLTLQTAGTWINTLSPSVNLTSDNLLFPSSNPTLDGGGIVFSGSSLTSKSRYFNIWGNSADNYTYFNNYDSFPYGSGPVDFTVINIGLVPEPSSLAIAGLGAIGFVVAGALCRRRQRAA